MYRHGFTNDGIIKEFRNNNINIKFSNDAITDINAGKFSDIEILSWLLSEIDSYFVGESQCISNYETGILIYNYHSDVCYFLNFSDIDKYLMTNKTLKLYSYKPDKDTRDYINYFEGV
jgi:hypothetical protein